MDILIRISIAICFYSYQICETNLVNMFLYIEDNPILLDILITIEKFIL